ncbi:hypothetical protein COR50_04115 [Chitinophaga caeni]|uniref:DUF4374 domain-containing protein n=1 Tax=Chitinophaga caeni TaxID=2029983 RepID=A0A291QRA2_9BACT|nr:DUF4374 domain-containing protein [Chitinophaga caeni]ATL46423.1 hypothetical protein COR50_04115 [Chitinophaga caeni]
MKKLNLLFLSTAIAFGMASCDKDDNPSTGGGDAGAGTGRFVIAALPQSAAEGVADYLFTAEDLESGTLSTAGNGVEQDGTYRYYTTSKNLFFSMLYGQGNPGAVTIYKLDDQGKLSKQSNFQSETVQAFAAVADDILMMKISRRVTTENSLWYKVNTESLTISGQGQINTAQLSGNGEMAHFSWLKQVGNKVFAPFFSIKGSGDALFATAYPDSSWIAVFNYPDMSLNTIIRDNRSSFIGAYFNDGLEVVENGDVYAWSSPFATSDGASFNSTKPSAIMRIKSGELAWDQSYFFDVSDASGGSYICDKLYLGDGNFILFMSDKQNAYASGANKFAVANVNTKSFKWVTGTPGAEDITVIAMNNYAPKDGKTGFIGITTTDGKSVVYKFDAGTATATSGLVLTGGTINSINWLPSAE